MNNYVVFRVDASQKFGTGHVARTRHLAKQFVDGGYSVTWLATEETFQLVPELTRLYQTAIVSEHDSQTVQINNYFDTLGGQGPMPAVFVQDGFQMDAETVAAVKTRSPGTKHVVVDDKANRYLGNPDLVIDPSVRDLSAYTSDIVDDPSKVLIGPEYQMLDPGFQTARDKRNAVSDKDEIILMNGGNNIGNLLGVLVNGFADKVDAFAEYKFTLYTLSSAPYLGLLESQIKAAEDKGLNIDLRLDQKPDFTRTALYVGAAGTACYELGAVGGVASVLIGAGHNQDRMGMELADRAAAYYAGQFLELDMAGTFNLFGLNISKTIIEKAHAIVENDTARQIMEENSAAFCDGMGAARVYETIIDRLAPSPDQKVSRFPNPRR